MGQGPFSRIQKETLGPLEEGYSSFSVCSLPSQQTKRGEARKWVPDFSVYFSRETLPEKKGRERHRSLRDLVVHLALPKVPGVFLWERLIDSKGLLRGFLVSWHLSCSVTLEKKGTLVGEDHF